jgi:cytochrome c biogenesis protein CcdA
MNRLKYAVPVLVAALLLACGASVVLAQEGLPASGLGSQNLRPYWHVFIAYTIAIAMVLGWVISISRRLRDVEQRLGE